MKLFLFCSRKICTVVHFFVDVMRIALLPPQGCQILAGCILLVLMTNPAAPQIFDQSVLPESAYQSRWEASFFGAYSETDVPKSYAYSAAGLMYRTSMFEIGLAANFNQDQHFTFLPGRLIIKLGEKDIEFADNTRFSQRPDQYEINEPISLIAKVKQNRFSLMGSVSILTQHVDSESLSYEVVSDSLFFINWESISNKNAIILGKALAGFTFSNLTIKAGFLNIPIVRTGTECFKYEFRPEIQPYMSLDYQFQNSKFAVSKDAKSISFEYAHVFLRNLFHRKQVVETDLFYRNGIGEYPFHALRVSVGFPLADDLKARIGCAKVWSSAGMSSKQAFENWQKSIFLDAGYYRLDSTLPHQSAFFNLTFTFRKKRKAWPLRVVKTQLHQNHLFSVMSTRYAEQPIGTIELYNEWKDPIRVQLILATTSGSGSYRSEAFVIEPAAIKKQYFNLYLKNNIIQSLVSQEQLIISAVVENQSRIVTSVPITVFGKNAWNGNTQDLRYFVSPQEPKIKNNAEKLFHLATKESESIRDQSCQELSILKSFLTKLGEKLAYLPDPISKIDLDYVQFPMETVERGGGDCEDLTVYLASSLMALGVHTAVVDIRPKNMEMSIVSALEPGKPGHVFLLVDTGISITALSRLRLSEFQGISRKNRTGRKTIWLPIETSVISQGFDEAFKQGVMQYYREVVEKEGVTKGVVQVYDF